jgi:hypothetical protein
MLSRLRDDLMTGAHRAVNDLKPRCHTPETAAGQHIAGRKYGGRSRVAALSELEAIATERRQEAHSWQRHSVVEPADACRVLDEILEWYKSYGPSCRWDMAVFWRMDHEGVSEFFFSPRLCALSPAMPRRYRAKPCAPPSCLEGAALLVGDVRAVRLIER